MVTGKLVGLAEVPQGVLCRVADSEQIIYVTERTESDYSRMGEGYPIDRSIIEHCDAHWGVDEIKIIEDGKTTYSFDLDQHLARLPADDELDPIVPLREAQRVSPALNIPAVTVNKDDLFAVALPEKFRGDIS